MGAAVTVRWGCVATGSDDTGTGAGMGGLAAGAAVTTGGGGGAGGGGGGIAGAACVASGGGTVAAGASAFVVGCDGAASEEELIKPCTESTSAAAATATPRPMNNPLFDFLSDAGSSRLSSAPRRSTGATRRDCAGAGTNDGDAVTDAA